MQLSRFGDKHDRDTRALEQRPTTIRNRAINNQAQSILVGPVEEAILEQLRESLKDANTRSFLTRHADSCSNPPRRSRRLTASGSVPVHVALGGRPFGGCRSKLRSPRVVMIDKNG
jgi:hypothetical protein